MVAWRQLLLLELLLWVQSTVEEEGIEKDKLCSEARKTWLWANTGIGEYSLPLSIKIFARERMLSVHELWNAIFHQI